MAQEIYVEASLSGIVNGERMRAGVRGTLDMGSTNYINAAQVIGTDTEAIDFGDVVAATSLLYIRNTDATNRVGLCIDNAYAKPFAELPAGSGALFWPGRAVYAKAYGEAVTIEKVALGVVTVNTLETFDPALPDADYVRQRIVLNVTKANISLGFTMQVDSTGMDRHEAESFVAAVPTAALLFKGQLASVKPYFLFARNAGAAVVKLSLDDAASDHFASLAASNGFALLPMCEIANPYFSSASATPLVPALGFGQAVAP